MLLKNLNLSPKTVTGSYFIHNQQEETKNSFSATVGLIFFFAVLMQMTTIGAKITEQQQKNKKKPHKHLTYFLLK